MKNQPYRIQRAAVIGAGVMGAAIAAQLANAGIPVTLLDIVLPDNPDRNFLAKQGIQRALKARPAAFMDPARASLITPGNLEDDLKKLKDADWILEAIIEKLDAKRDLWAKVEGVAKKTAILSSNSSGIPMHLQIEGRSEDFQRRFVGAHFFNPPRYLHLLEVIPTPKTDPEVLGAFIEFGENVLGKGIVIANDVPGFVANRIGVYGIVRAMQHMQEAGLTPDEVDQLTGPALGRAKSATFRTADLSGLDIIYHVANDLNKATPENEDFSLTDTFKKLVEEKKFLGDKTGSGFYKKTKDEKGKTKILSLNLDTLEYEDRGKVKVPLVEQVKNLPLAQRVKALYNAEGREGDFLRGVMDDGFWYAAKMAGNVSNRLQDIDNALKWGFGWEEGPFETMDTLGVQNVIANLEKEGRTLPPLLQKMKETGRDKFYQEGETVTPAGEPTQYQAPYFILTDLKKDATKVVKKRPGASIVDLGDGVLLVEWHAKMNALGEDQLRAVQDAHKLVQEMGYAGLVLGNQGENFSAGANLPLILSQAQDEEWDELDSAVKQFQQMTTSMRFSPHPTVAAPFNLALGGGCEFSIHADHIVASAELYMGLVEVGVGLIPGGGGTKEMLLRFTDQIQPGQPLLPAVQRAFELIGTAKVSTSALEARKLGFLRDHDTVVMNKNHIIEEAKRMVLALAPGYIQPTPRQDIPVMGDAAIAAVKMALYGMTEGGYATKYDAVVAGELARVLSGGTGNNRNAKVSEQHLLDLEREAFLTLLGKKGTQDRIAHMLKTGKPLRN
ncbi:3-hydroxyacyl-CoA dehydrogenase/enoyl-CoA hydratase family protein [Deinococcus metallilatus]|uniref:3-hydroxyacyl-CoA dehydrogenase n=1 Tax=Deinococcus metallilatus TaxID=1211322 RepID=A0AAJ5JYU1_9DEIO|nr:3-hydroxyacyl-CoA dehydrogenase/enoyl-CoA hydratase family protein [Deinococcus metallilatus]MBB5295004.1 3-hydroxyacyl-CoA dehydrogenase [Deinococcus metallilatus]QBY09304.1 3-hydroxyacyl-CoA dehydrogenase/enoyl-CoA hydratase family protein [Deinococcus metallilatus]RXJ09309.1 3-hydroxyacyl-CoA dehydrogenase/enoyl-CoA hydratase family protein [Deinococcus metallilatus]TLK28831.1 3-hydroxyacyl-CoA dehydrogenase [Deinococcus metallilatus]GMA16937.1 3-hydroxyacyl-CoA dehydrogenase [Deinococcu